MTTTTVRGLAAATARMISVAAIQTFPQSDATSNGRFDALANRNLSRLAESINESIAERLRFPERAVMVAVPGPTPAAERTSLQNLVLGVRL